VEHLVELRASGGVLESLAKNLALYGPAGGEPEWLLGGVWLCTGEAQYLATSSVEVLADGQVARPLNIATAAEIVRDIGAELSDVAGRLAGRGSDIALDQPPPPAPGTLKPWPAEPYSTCVLVRPWQRASHINRVACGLLFKSGSGPNFLVGTDVSSLAMVASEDAALIERYCAGCDALSLPHYFELCSR
jgi:hypothetical protein